MVQRMRKGQKTNCRETVLSFHLMGPEGEARVINAGIKNFTH